jgi:hypothetical protein
MAVLILHQQKREKYATLLQGIIVNNAMGLVVDILNICGLT